MSHHILVVEDEPDINKTVSYNLANEGFYPVSALNLQEADDQLSSNNISFVAIANCLSKKVIFSISSKSYES